MAGFGFAEEDEATRRKRLEAERLAAAAAGFEGDPWGNAGDEARMAQEEAATIRRERERAEKMTKATRLAEEIDRLDRQLQALGVKLKPLAGYREDNCAPNEWAQMKKRREPLEADEKALKEKHAKLWAELAAELDRINRGPTAVGLPVDLAGVLDMLLADLHRLFVIDEADAQIVALWIVHTHVFMHEIETFAHSPHLIVWSQEKGSGKSNLRRYIAKTVPVNVLALERLVGTRVEKNIAREQAKRLDDFWIEFYQKHGLVGLGLKTYLFDEADRITYTDTLVSLLNSTHQRDGQMLDFRGEPQAIFAPVGLFRIGNPQYDPNQDTTVSRSIIIEMKMLDPENLAHRRARWLDADPRIRRLPVLRRQIAEVVKQRAVDFGLWTPAEGWDGFLLGNRNTDNWAPLVAIGDLAGGHWPQTARRLAMTRPMPAPPSPAPAGAAGSLADYVKRAPAPGRPSDGEKIRARIMPYMQTVKRCRRTDLGEKALGNNFKSAAIEAVLAELAAADLINLTSEAPGPKGGPRTLWVELVEPPAPSDTTPDTTSDATSSDTTSDDDSSSAEPSDDSDDDSSDTPLAADETAQWCARCKAYLAPERFRRNPSGTYRTICKLHGVEAKKAARAKART